MDWLDLLAVQGTLKRPHQHHKLKASILWHSAFFIVQLSHLYTTTGKSIALTTWTFVGKGRLYCTLMPTLPKMISDLMTRGNLDPETEIRCEHHVQAAARLPQPRNHCQQQLPSAGFRRRVALLTPWPWPSSLQDCETTSCCLSQLVCGTLFQQPQKTEYRGNPTSNFLQLPISCRSPSWYGSIFTSASVEHFQGWEQCPWGNASNYWITLIISLYGCHTFAM